MTNGIDSQNKVGSWDQWAVHLIKTLESQNKDIEQIKRDISHIRTDLAVIKSKAAIIGAVTAAGLTGIINLVVFLLLR